MQPPTKKQRPLAKNIFYRYNPETDNFERFFPTLKMQLLSWVKAFIRALILFAIIFLFVFYVFESPTQKNLKEENKRLKTQYGVLSRRLDNTLKVIENIRERDNNFYRVMMQLDPLNNPNISYGFNSEERFRELSSLPDAKLVERLSNRMDLLENLIYTQIQSYDDLKKAIEENQEKLTHIPSILPINLNDYTMSSGYGYRRDPIYGLSKFHEGLDFAASNGTDVFATADGKVEVARREAGYGNCVDINHGFNYMSRYAHLSEILVKEGEEVKRGQLIGKVGSTGKSTGPHLHYEVRFKDEPQNPVNYYFMDLTPEQYSLMIQEAENAGHVMD